MCLNDQSMTILNQFNDIYHILLKINRRLNFKKNYLSPIFQLIKLLAPKLMSKIVKLLAGIKIAATMGDK